MATTRYNLKILVDGGAFPVSLRALFRARLEETHVPKSGGRGQLIGGIVFDGGSFPQRLGHALARFRKRPQTAPQVESLRTIAKRQSRRYDRVASVR